VSQPTQRQQIAQAAAFIQARTRQRPTVGLITGSGLAELAGRVAQADRIPYTEIPHFPASTVEGHPGQLLIGQLAGKTVAVLQGRAHFYEGYTPQQVTLPIRVLKALGAAILIQTNAAGGLNPAFRAGDLMLITDHINLVGVAGFNPLHGPNDASLGPRFPNMTTAYDAELRGLALQVAGERGLELRQGIYVMVAGPSFETPAELHYLRLIGADAVGMSTAIETVTARHVGLRVLGISLISNMATGAPGEIPATPAGLHEEVLAAGRAAVPRLSALIEGVLQYL